MKAEILSINGEKIKEIELPKVFSEKIRQDIVQKVFETEKRIQAYSPAPMAGRQHSASGTIRHIRHKWRTAYGKGISRVPRKTMWRRGTQFYWIGAEISSTRGGRRAHGPKLAHFNIEKKINKKEKQLALRSAISSTINSKILADRYSRVDEKNVKKLPFIIESKITSIKTKDLLVGLKKILGNLFEVSKKEKTLRAGKGKLRGRKYKRSQGLLMVTGNEENLNVKIFDVKKVKDLRVSDLYPLGRVTVYTEKAIKDLESFNKEKN
ncbi:MAG: 50S ribosomal protein L4 [Nanoarchaeota archaeon]